MWLLLKKEKLAAVVRVQTRHLLQYSGEKMFTDLIHTFGYEYIERHLQLLKEAINEIETGFNDSSTSIVNLAEETPFTCASCPEDVGEVEKQNMNF